MDQLAWFAHHRRFDPKQLSERFTRRLRRFLALHGIDELVEGDAPRVAHALLRLFQARRSQEDASTLALAILRALARSQPAEADAAPSVDRAAGDLREACERSRAAGRPQGRDGGMEPHLSVAGSARVAGRDRTRSARGRAAVGAAVRCRNTGKAQARSRSALLALPLGCARPRAGGARQPSRVRVSDLLAPAAGAHLRSDGSRASRRRCWDAIRAVHLRTPTGAEVAGVLVDEPCDLAAILACSFPADAEVDLLLGYVPAADAFDVAARNLRPRWTALWVEDGEMRARTWKAEGNVATEQTPLRDFHPARPVAQEIARFANFTLERLPAPSGLLLLRAVAPGDDRLVAMAEVERFDAGDRWGFRAGSQLRADLPQCGTGPPGRIAGYGRQAARVQSHLALRAPDRRPRTAASGARSPGDWVPRPSISHCTRWRSTAVSRSATRSRRANLRSNGATRPRSGRGSRS